MLIHTVRAGDTIFGIAKKYGVPPSKIIEYNDLKNPDRLPVGLEVLIVMPTRYYAARRGEGAEDIAKRFGIEKRALKRANPYLTMSGKACADEVVTVKCDAPQHASILLNGQLYRGYDPKRLDMALEYAKYITISSHKVSRGEICRAFDDRHAIKSILSAGGTPIMRIFDPNMKSTLENFGEKFTRDAINTAKSHGYRGIAFTPSDAGDDDKICEVLLNIKRQMMECGLLFFIEDDRYTKAHDIADAVVVRYEKCHLADIPSFLLGEERHFSDYADKGESIKAFMDFSPFAFAAGDQITKRDAVELAYRYGAEIDADKESLICRFEYGKKDKQNCSFESLENIKAKLELLSELGFMGMSFDVTRCPIEHLIMCLCEFSLCDYSSFEI